MEFNGTHTKNNTDNNNINTNYFRDTIYSGFCLMFFPPKNAKRKNIVALFLAIFNSLLFLLSFNWIFKELFRA